MAITNENMISSAFVRQFADTYELAAQQTESKLQATVESEGEVVGSSFTINDLGSIEFTTSANKFDPTNLTIPTAGTRVVTMTDSDLAVVVSPHDLKKLKADPTDSYMKSIIAARNRLIDKTIYNGLVSPILRKTAEADSGLVSTAIPAGQNIVSGGTGFTKAKLIAARSLFAKNNVDEELYIIYNHKVLQDVLADTELTSADYLAVQALQAGDIKGTWMGFNWVHYEGLADGADNTEFKTVAYAKSAAVFGNATVKSLGMDTRPDLKYATQIGCIESFGCGRTNELKTVTLCFKKV
jgi:hypothetical protein